VWANVIGLMLAFLALGYWLGGRVADARPHPTLLGRILLAASLLLAVTPFAARPLLRVALRGFDELSIGIAAGSFLAVLALFALPVTLMGAVGRRSPSGSCSRESRKRGASPVVSMHSRLPAASSAPFSPHS
jgi:hypothetical protein